MMEHTFHTPDPIEVAVSNATGSVELRCEDVADTTVVVEYKRGSDDDLVARTKVSHEGGRVRVEVPSKRWGSTPRVDVRITAPLGSRLVARIASADVRCSGRLSGLAVTGASGDVWAEQVDGDARLELASGDVRLESVTGAALVRTASGDVQVERAGSGDLQTASGDVLVGSVAGGLEVRTASGDVRIGEAATGAVEVNTASGDIALGVRRGTAVHLDLSSHSGDLRSELTVEDAAPTDGAALELRLHSISGDIQVRRGATAPVA